MYNYVEVKQYSLKQPIACSGQCVSVGWSIIPYTKTLKVRFPVGVHTQVMGSIPSQGAYGRQPINISPTLSKMNNGNCCTALYTH